MEGAFARLEGQTFEYYMSKRRVVIGRNSKQGAVDVNMGSSRYISRRHVEIFMDKNCFYLLCRGKNGIFVDDIFQRRENKRLQLPPSCIVRFPSTEIKISFTSLLEEMGPPLIHASSPLPTLKPCEPLLFSPFVSPMPSPTGTISAVNSCPTSPSSDHRHRLPSFDAMAKYASKLLSSNHVEARTETNASEEDSAPQAPPMPVNVAANEEEAPSDELNDKAGGADDAVEDSSSATGNSHQKPPYSYAQLIVQALLFSIDRRQTLSSIYQFISDKYPYYRMEEKGWKNSIRHNLSLNQYFMKAPREKEGLGFGKGGYWCMHPDYEEKLTSQAYVKRKKKGIPVFPSAGLMSRSAPSSPTHHLTIHTSDFSREQETTFALPPPPASTQFSLSQILPHFSKGMVGPPCPTGPPSRSLPASPSRAPPLFSATMQPLKFFPLGLHTHHSSTDALALEQPARSVARHKTFVPPGVPLEPIEEGGGGGGGGGEGPPEAKRAKVEGQVEVAYSCDGVVAHGESKLYSVRSIPSLPHVSPGGPPSFIPMPLSITTTGGQGSSKPHPPPHVLTQPLSTFLPRGFFTGGAPAPPLPPPKPLPPPPPPPPPPSSTTSPESEG